MIHPHPSVSVDVFSGPDIAPYLGDLARLRLEVFRAYPYLYDGSVDYEREYLSRFAATDDGVLVVARDGDEVVGASSGIPLSDEFDEFRAPFEAAGIDPARVFYLSESVLARPYRGRGIYRAFFEGREAHARRLGRFDTLAFCAIERPADHPMRPVDYRPLDAVWRARGYVPRADLRTTFEWKEIFESAESPKPMIFWTKPL